MTATTQLTQNHQTMPANTLALLQTAVQQSFNAVVITTAAQDASGPRITYCNTAFCKMTGYDQDELLGQSPRILQGPLTSQEVIQTLRESLAKGTIFQGSTVNYRKDGSSYLVEWNISPVYNNAGVIEAFVSVQQDITAQFKAEKLKNLLAHALHATEDAVLIADMQARIVFVNHAFEKQSGYLSTEAIGRTPKFLQSGRHPHNFYTQLRERLNRGENCRISISNRHKDGHIYHTAQTITPLKDEAGEIRHYVSVSKDISEDVETTKALRKQAHTDALTGLLNRHAGKLELRRCEQHAQKNQQRYALVLADIDEFKQINDTYGHHVGDQVLQGCADLLKNAIRNSDSVARWGGEEFLIILPDCHLHKASEIAERIRNTIASWIEPTVGTITLSLGVALWSPSESYNNLLQRADQALYQAKQNGRNQVIIAP